MELGAVAPAVGRVALVGSSPPALMSTSLPLSFTVTNPDGVAWARALVEGGFPFAQGVVADVGALSVSDAGVRLALQARALGFWGDGSVRWALLTFEVEGLGAGEVRALELGELGSAEVSVASWAAPQGTFSLLDNYGATSLPIIPLGSWESVSEGPVYAERVSIGELQAREFITGYRLSVAAFPGQVGERHRLVLKQLENAGTWSSMTLSHPHALARVHSGSELGAVVTPGLVTFISSARPVDTGMGRQWELWFLNGAAPFTRDPLRPDFPSGYVRATKALGRLPESVPAQWLTTFDAHYHSTFDGLAADPLTSGWEHWGDTKTRLESAEYLGYYNQEYGPAEALYQAHAVTGTREYLESALEFSGFYRDMLVNHLGGCFQHRAPLNGVIYWVAVVVGDGIEAAITAFAGGTPDDQDIYDWVELNFGTEAADETQEVIDDLAHLSQAKRTNLVTEFGAASIIHPKVVALQDSGLTVYETAQELALDPDLTLYGYTDADADFVPYFARYGGDWANLPRQVVDLHPLENRRHTSSHTHVEMLVYGYWYTGDRYFLEVAETLANNYINRVLPRAKATIEFQIALPEQPIILRELGWAVINLLALEELTRWRNVSLNLTVWDRLREAVRVIGTAPLLRIENTVHAGITIESLARYDERTGDPLSRKYLAELAYHWANTMWDPADQEFRYEQGLPGTLGKWSNGLMLLGLLHSSEVTPSFGVAYIGQAAYLPLLTVTVSDGKDFAQKYRSTWRALDYLASMNRTLAEVQHPKFRVRRGLWD